MLTNKSLTVLLLISIAFNVILLTIIFIPDTSSIFQIKPNYQSVNNTLIGKECIRDSECQQYWSCVEGTCRCPITKEYNPVCGVDGKTYGNPSEARCKGVEISSNGACSFYATEKKCYECGNTCILGDIFEPPACPPSQEQFNCVYFDEECVREDVFNSKQGVI